MLIDDSVARSELRASSLILRTWCFEYCHKGSKALRSIRWQWRVMSEQWLFRYCRPVAWYARGPWKIPFSGYFISEIIECIGKTYSQKQHSNVLIDAHFELLVDATKVSFNLLKILRDGGAPDEVLTKRCQGVYKKFIASSDLFKRNDQNQKEVDSLLEKLGI